MEWSRATEVKVGLFVVIGLALFAIALVVIGSERSVFDQRIYFKVALPSASGITGGTTVRMAGISVGRVESTSWSSDLANPRIIVVFSIRPSNVGRVRRDSEVRIGTKGLLGDKQLEVTIGSPTEPMLPEWSYLRASRRGGGIIENAEQTLSEVQMTLGKVQRAMEPLTDPRFGEDLRATAAELRALTQAVRQGDGAAHRLIYERRTADQIDSVLSSLVQMSHELTDTARTVRSIAHEVQSGSGTAHALVYGTEGVEALANLSNASTEIAALAHDIRTEDGLLHSMIYTNEQRNLLVNLTEASAGVRQIVGDLRAGRGTIGALLADPSVYEDLKRVVGNVGRSKVLRALVRFAITEDEAQRPPRATVRPRPQQSE